jgi:7-carboxy-7-deazaguanine synthase
MDLPPTIARRPLDLNRERPIIGSIASEKLQLVEIFDSLQGEGPDIGIPARFVRLGECNRRCSWCDTDYATRFELLIEDFVALMSRDYASFAPHELAYVIFTGGEPTLHARHLNSALDMLELNKQVNWFWACESNGTLLALPEVVHFYQRLNRVVISPKPPSSQNVAFDWPRFWSQVDAAGIAEKLDIKPVVMDDTDMTWFRAAAEAADRPLSVPFIMQTYVDPDPSCDALADFRGYWRRTLTPEFIAWMRRYNVRLLPRLHNLIWGNQQGF